MPCRPCEESSCVTPALRAAGLRGLIRPDIQPDGSLTKAGSSNTGQGLVAAGCRRMLFCFQHWSTVGVMISRRVRRGESKHIVHKLVDGTKGCCGWSSRRALQLSTSCPCGDSSSFTQKWVACTKEHRPWRPANHARHYLGVFCGMCPVLDVLFCSVSLKREQPRDTKTQLKPFRPVLSQICRIIFHTLTTLSLPASVFLNVSLGGYWNSRTTTQRAVLTVIKPLEKSIQYQAFSQHFVLFYLGPLCPFCCWAEYGSH